MLNLNSSIYAHRWNQDELAAMRKVWAVLTGDFFQKFIRQDGTVLDLGAGFCHFINEVQAKRKIAFDANPEIRKFANPEVDVVISDDLKLGMFKDGELTHVFMSNFLEHLPDSNAVVDLLSTLRRKIEPGGSVLILQPNFTYTGAAYFDFVDHRVILTDKSLIEALEVAGFSVPYCQKRFLPYTSKKSRFPKSPLLVRVYLKFPLLWHLFGQQTFVIGQT